MNKDTQRLAGCDDIEMGAPIPCANSRMPGLLKMQERKLAINPFAKAALLHYLLSTPIDLRLDALKEDIKSCLPPKLLVEALQYDVISRALRLSLSLSLQPAKALTS